VFLFFLFFFSFPELRVPSAWLDGRVSFFLVGRVGFFSGLDSFSGCSLSFLGFPLSPFSFLFRAGLSWCLLCLLLVGLFLAFGTGFVLEDGFLLLLLFFASSRADFASWGPALCLGFSLVPYTTVLNPR